MYSRNRKGISRRRIFDSAAGRQAASVDEVTEQDLFQGLLVESRDALLGHRRQFFHVLGSIAVKLKQVLPCIRLRNPGESLFTRPGLP